MRRVVVAAMLAALGLAAGPAGADDEFTLYELLDPDTHRFAISFDVTTSRAGARYYLNGIRAGSEVYDERVVDRAEQDREITYWLDDPATGSFKISHHFTVSEPGQRYVHNFVRAGSEVSEPSFFDLNTGSRLLSVTLTGQQVNAAGTYSRQLEDDAIVVQAEMVAPIAKGHTTRIRVIETYTDRERYYIEGDELVWDRTLGRPRNVVTLPAGWMLTSISTPAVIFEDSEGRTALRFVNPRNDSVHVVLRARKRPGAR